MQIVHFWDESLPFLPFQKLYLNEDFTLKPNLTFVDKFGKTWFTTNELGLKGSPRDNKPLIIAWGDSVVFGVGRGWPELLNDLDPNHQYMNGGIEGDHYTNVLSRALDFNETHRVKKNILFIGWHTHGQNKHVEQDLTIALETLPNVILLTIPTPLNEDIITLDLEDYFGKDFGFYGALPYSVKLQQEIFAHVLERNAIIRRVAEKTNTALIDLYQAFKTNSLNDFRQNFFDMQHPRRSAYYQIAECVRTGVLMWR